MEVVKVGIPPPFSVAHEVKTQKLVGKISFYFALCTVLRRYLQNQRTIQEMLDLPSTDATEFMNILG